MKILPTKGCILLAEPFLKDEYFIRSVVLLVEYSSNEGAFGFLLNRALDLKIKDAVDGFPVLNTNIFLGGPVQRDHLFYLHTKGNLIKDSKKIIDNLYWGGNFEILKKEIEKGTITENDIKFFAGYSGWESGQLERELQEKSWIISRATTNQIFKTDPEKMWKFFIKQMGPDYAPLINYPIDPRLN